IMEFYKNTLNEKIVEQSIPIVQERLKKLSEYLPLCDFLFKKPKTYEIDLKSKKELLEKINQSLLENTDWQATVIGDKMMQIAKESGLKNSEFFMILRVVITGKKISPPLNESMVILGKEECLSRIRAI
ncbi:MAG: glutamate--tRNA ligase, partial [bacterium]|nr:glutamate--tRNA ligase [bacterium]